MMNLRSVAAYAYALRASPRRHVAHQVLCDKIFIKLTLLGRARRVLVMAVAAWKTSRILCVMRTRLMATALSARLRGSCA